MDKRDTPSLPQELAAAIDWWCEAGVDSDYTDEPLQWLAETPESASPNGTQRQQEPPQRQRTPPPVEQAPAAPAIGGDPAAWPKALGEFAPWWLAEPSLDLGGTNSRIAPMGPHGAALMVLVPEPEADDRDRLLSGAQGRLLDALLQAMGLARDECYIAAVLPRHTPMADWGHVKASGMDKILRHHVALAAPQRVIVLGRSILPLLGHDPAQSAQFLRQLNQESGNVPLFAARSLEALANKPLFRAQLWQRWLEWTE